MQFSFKHCIQIAIFLYALQLFYKHLPCLPMIVLLYTLVALKGRTEVSGDSKSIMTKICQSWELPFWQTADLMHRLGLVTSQTINEFDPHAIAACFNYNVHTVKKINQANKHSTIKDMIISAGDITRLKSYLKWRRPWVVNTGWIHRPLVCCELWLIPPLSFWVWILYNVGLYYVNNSKRDRKEIVWGSPFPFKKKVDDTPNGRSPRKDWFSPLCVMI